jgi:hypothetical protein
MRRKGRIQWRVILGLGFLGFLILASASSHASSRLLATSASDGVKLENGAGLGLTP